MVTEIDTACPQGVCSRDEDGQEFSNSEACRILMNGHQGETEVGWIGRLGLALTIDTIYKIDD